MEVSWPGVELVETASTSLNKLACSQLCQPPKEREAHWLQDGWLFFFLAASIQAIVLSPEEHVVAPLPSLAAPFEV